MIDTPQHNLIDKNLGLVRGSDGYSPTVAVEDIENGHRVTITDKSGAKSIDVLDGATGPQGPAGEVTTEQLNAALEPYRTASAQDEIDAAQNERIGAAAQATDSTTVGPAPVVSFDASSTGMPLRSVMVNIEPVQEGEGDPSPENVRPITGWTEAEISYSGADTSDPEIVTIAFPPEAGTIYSGDIDVKNGILTNGIYRKVKISSAWTWYRQTISGQIYFCTIARKSELASSKKAILLCDTFKPVRSTSSGGIDTTQADMTIVNAWSRYYPLTIRYDAITTVNDFETYLSTHEVYALFPIGEETKYQIAPQEYAVAEGTNNIWADCGDVTVTYGAYLEAIKAHADRLGDSILESIAPLETTYTASRNYSIGAFLFVGTKFYKVVAAIANGGTITPGANVTQTTVAEQLIALASA